MKHCILAATLLLLAAIGRVGRGDFSTIINLPPNPTPSSIGSDTQLNVLEGGFLRSSQREPFTASGANVEVNVRGGMVGDHVDALAGSVFNISGGTVGSSFEAEAGSIVAISGGTIGDHFDALSGSTITVSGGTIGRNFDAREGSDVTITDGLFSHVLFARGKVDVSGGSFGHGFGGFDAFRALGGSNVMISGGVIRRLTANHNSEVEIAGGTFAQRSSAASGTVTLSGGDFLLNGLPPDTSIVSLADSDTLSGVFEDGSPFIFASETLDNMRGVTLVYEPLPSTNTTPMIVDNTNAPIGLRAGQSLTLLEGGLLPQHFAAVNATLHIEGGTVGEGLEVIGSEVMISGGTVSSKATDGLGLTTWFAALEGSVVNVTGGTIEDQFLAGSGSEVNIAGGRIEGVYFVERGSRVHISDGFVNWIRGDSEDVMITGGFVRAAEISGGRFTLAGGDVGEMEVAGGAEVAVTGGSFGGITTGIASRLTFSGDEFRFNGVAPSQSSVLLSGSDVLSGTLEDGTPFVLTPSIFTPSDVDPIEVTLIRSPVPMLDTTPIVVDDDVAPRGIRDGQSLTLREGGTLNGTFSAVNASLTIDGGRVLNGTVKLEGTTTNILEGKVSSSVVAFNGSVVNVFGGSTSSMVGHGASDIAVAGGTVDRLTGLSGSSIAVTGGAVGKIRAETGSSVAIFGGKVEGRIDAQSGAEVLVSGGITDLLEAAPGSVVTLAGGRFGALRTQSDSNVMIRGGEYLLNSGRPVSNTVTLTDSDILTGTLADGSPFIVSRFEGNLALSDVMLSAVDTTPINVDSDNGPNGLRAGQTLVLLEGGRLGDHFAAVNATLSVDGGEAGGGLEVIGSTVNISDGSIGEQFTAYVGSEVNISGGVVGNDVNAFSSVINVSAGTIGDNFQAYASNLSISGGSFGNRFRAFDGSSIHISGGTFGREFSNISTRGSSNELTISGGEFQLSGVEINSGTVDVRGGVLTGTFSDGSPFIFEQHLGPVTFVVEPLPAAEVSPIVINSESPLEGVRTNQTLLLEDGGDLKDHFRAVNATITVNGGNIGDELAVAGSRVEVNSGVIGNGFATYADSEVVTNGGTIRELRAIDSRISVHGGIIDRLTTFESDVLVSSGKIVELNAYGGTVTYRGGTFDVLRARPGAIVNIVGTSFEFDHRNIGADLVLNVPTVVDARDEKLEGVLLDGQPFSFDLSRRGREDHFFDPEATLMLTLRLCGDFDFDGDVDAADRTVQVANWTGALTVSIGDVSFEDGDCDGDQDVDTVDQLLLIRNWTGAAQTPAFVSSTEGRRELFTVPEPTRVGFPILALLSGSVFIRYRGATRGVRKWQRSRQ